MGDGSRELWSRNCLRCRGWTLGCCAGCRRAPRGARRRPRPRPAGCLSSCPPAPSVQYVSTLLDRHVTDDRCLQELEPLDVLGREPRNTTIGPCAPVMASRFWYKEGSRLCARPTMSVDCSLAFGELPGECSGGGDARASCSRTDSMCDPPRMVMSSAHKPAVDRTPCGLRNCLKIPPQCRPALAHIDLAKGAITARAESMPLQPDAAWQAPVDNAPTGRCVLQHPATKTCGYLTLRHAS